MNLSRRWFLLLALVAIVFAMAPATAASPDDAVMLYIWPGGGTTPHQGYDVINYIATLYPVQYSWWKINWTGEWDGGSHTETVISGTNESPGGWFTVDYNGMGQLVAHAGGSRWASSHYTILAGHGSTTTASQRVDAGGWILWGLIGL